VTHELEHSGVDPSEMGWEPANFQICRFKKYQEARIDCSYFGLVMPWVGLSLSGDSLR
jgi:hypothetical protein